MTIKKYVVTGKSESSDIMTPAVFSKKPTDEQLKKCIESMGESINEDGPGDFGSWVFLKIYEVKEDKI